MFAEKILNLVLGKSFSFEVYTSYSIIASVIANEAFTGEILNFHGMIYYMPDQR